MRTDDITEGTGNGDDDVELEEMSEAELETLYKRALKEGSRDRQGETMAGIVRRHFGDVLPERGMNQPSQLVRRLKLPSPTPAEIRSLRGPHSQEEMAQLAGLASEARWSEYERGTRRPHWALWELILLRMGKHPSLRLVER
jgi:hypothetical protein